MNNDLLNKLEKLADLKEKGIITEEEFNSNKRILLDSLNSCNNIPAKEDRDGTYWLPIPSMILGIFVMLACFDGGKWDKNTFVGAFFFIILSFTLGIVSIYTQKKGRGMAITGITLSVIAGLIIIGYII